jgi:hypothetical protein
MTGNFFEGKIPEFGKENPGRERCLLSFEKSAAAYIEHASKFRQVLVLRNSGNSSGP